MAEAEQSLPTRPRAYPRLIPGRIDIWRLVAIAAVVFTVILQIVVIYAKHEATNDYGTFHAVDPVGFPFYVAGGLLDLFMVCMAFYVRHRHSKGRLEYYGYMPHPGLLVFIDLCVMGGCLGWGGLCVAFAILGEDAVAAVYSFAMMAVGLLHLKLVVDDCRYVRYRRQGKGFEVSDVVLDDISHQIEFR